MKRVGAKICVFPLIATLASACQWSAPITAANDPAPSTMLDFSGTFRNANAHDFGTIDININPSMLASSAQTLSEGNGLVFTKFPCKGGPRATRIYTNTKNTFLDSDGKMLAEGRLFEGKKITTIPGSAYVLHYEIAGLSSIAANCADLSFNLTVSLSNPSLANASLPNASGVNP